MPGARSTSPCRPASRSQPRSPRTSSRARPSGRRRAPGRAAARAGTALSSSRSPTSPAGAAVQVLRELVPGAPPRERVAARVHDEPVQPRRELRLAAELPNPRADLRERLLRRIAGVLGIAKDPARDLLDCRLVAGAQGLERLPVAVLRAFDQDGVAQPLVGERRARPQGLPDWTALRAQWLHLPHSTARWTTRSTQKPCSRCSGAASAGPTPTSSAANRPSACSRTTRPRGPSPLRTSRRRGEAGSAATGSHRRARACSRRSRSTLAVPTERLAELSLVAGRAVAQALADVAEVVPEVKWPNDVLIDGRKVAGILAEAREGRVVLGFGINVLQTEDELPQRAQHPATSLLLETGRRIPRAELLAARARPPRARARRVGRRLPLTDRRAVAGRVPGGDRDLTPTARQ